MMSETSAGRSATAAATAAGGGHETTTSTTTTDIGAKASHVGGISSWKLFAIEYETAIAASIGASISAIVGYR